VSRETPRRLIDVAGAENKTTRRRVGGKSGISAGERTVALQRTAGNAAVGRMLRRTRPTLRSIVVSFHCQRTIRLATAAGTDSTINAEVVRDLLSLDNDRVVEVPNLAVSRKKYAARLLQSACATWRTG
jgi:hypothetical protein